MRGPPPQPIARRGAGDYLAAMIHFIDLVLYILLAAVFVILAAGVFALFRGGDFGRSWSNRLMRLRVLFQFLAVMVIVLGFWLKNQLAGG